MALIGKIRSNYWIILVLLALALASFIIMDIIGSRKNPGGGLLGGRGTTIGEVAGSKIEYADFDRVERALYNGSTDVYSRRASLWNYLVEKSLVEKQAKCLGLGVSTEELMDLQFGANISPIIQNNFKNQQTGQLDRQILMQYKQAIETGTINGQPLTNEFRSYWAEQEHQIIKTKVQEKISELVAKGIYIPKWQAEVINQLNSEKVEFNFVKIPFDAIPESDVKLTDDDYIKYINENKGKYTNTDETRMIEYFTYEVAATAKDSAALKSEFDKLIVDFKTTQNDSVFTATNNGALSPVFNKPDDFSGPLKEKVKTMTVGEIYGPYLEEGRFIAAKLVAKQVVADSVKARHILKATKTPADVAGARKAIDSLKNLIVLKKASFDSLAIGNSDDPGSGSKGGDLGYFAQGTMVKEFNDLCFYSSSVGTLYTVTTQFGVHLIQVQDKKFLNQDPKYKIALISSAIVPSQETQDSLFDAAQEMIASHRTVEELKAATAMNPDIKVETTKPVKANDFILGSFPQSETSRSIIKWAFTAKKGDVSPAVYTFTNKDLYYNSAYVLTSLKSINPAGLLTVEAARSLIEAQVKNAKRGELIKAKIQGNDINAIATQFSAIVDTASNVNFNSGFIPKIQGAEPLVVAKAFSMEKDAVSGPIVGTSGVFVIKTLNREAAMPADPALAQRSSLASLRGNVSFKVWDALKKTYKPKDHRSEFY